MPAMRLDLDGFWPSCSTYGKACRTVHKQSGIETMSPCAQRYGYVCRTAHCTARTSEASLPYLYPSWRHTTWAASQ